ncbi:surface-adhesin E family protein [Burkholderia pyrrocinia]|uniref:surface-adhesin E family protein n=1 Tax=Burkholderia pyrrocinia TaxID=60550 RepID=UPI0012601F19|nr:surface-adhesin E family protein [Burkholderia pyrrocinia]
MKIRQLRGAAACISLAAACNTFAANWVEIGRSSDGTATVLLDVTSVAFSGGHAKAWFLQDNMYSLDVPGTYVNTRYVSDKALVLFNCDQRTSAATQTVYYDDHRGNGKVVWSWSTPPATAAYSDIVPDTIGEAMLESVCAFRHKTKPARKSLGPSM